MTEDAESLHWIGSDFRDAVTVQSYGPKPQIEGVTVVDLRTFSDEGGDFCEIGRMNQDGSLVHMPNYRPAQISYSHMEPGTIKAWHLHKNQDDLWFVPPGDRLLVGLLDVRTDSPTYQISTRLLMGAGAARLLLIPRGVAHGVANLSPRAASVIYFVNRQFDPADPDEHRLPHDLLGREFWSIQPA